MSRGPVKSPSYGCIYYGGDSAETSRATGGHVGGLLHLVIRTCHSSCAISFLRCEVVDVEFDSTKA